MLSHFENSKQYEDLMALTKSIFPLHIFKDKGLKAFDLVTPATAAGEYKDDLFFDYVEEEKAEIN